MPYYSGRRWLVFLTILGMVIVAGCLDMSEPPTKKKAKPGPLASHTTSTIPKNTKPYQPPKEIKLREVDYAEYEKTLDSLKGNIVVVDFWAEF